MAAHDPLKAESAGSRSAWTDDSTATSHQIFAADGREDKEFVVNAITAAGEARESSLARWA